MLRINVSTEKELKKMKKALKSEGFKVKDYGDKYIFMSNGIIVGELSVNDNTIELTETFGEFINVVDDTMSFMKEIFEAEKDHEEKYKELEKKRAFRDSLRA